MGLTGKFEKITLWTSIQTYGGPYSAGLSALDEIIPALDGLGEGKILDYDGEDYQLVKGSTRQPNPAIAKEEQGT